MAIAIDQANIGNAADNSSASTVAFNTTQAVPAGGFIVLAVCWYSSTETLSSVSGGGLTWAIDKQAKGTGAGDVSASVAIISAQAPSGLASGTTITATFSGSVPGRGIGGMSFTGVLNASALDTTSGPSDFLSTSAWTTSSTAIAAGSVLVGACFAVFSDGTSTVTSPSIEAQDFTAGAGTFGFTMCYRIESSAASYTVAGTWSNNQGGVVNAAAYKVGAGAVSSRQLSWHFA